MDQATVLRRLIAQRMRQKADRSKISLYAFLGEQNGAGTTSALINQAIKLVEDGQQVLAIDANAIPGTHGNLASICGVNNRPNIADLLTEKVTLEESVQYSPAGFGVVPGVCRVDMTPGGMEAMVNRLVDSLCDHSDQWSVILFDLGATANRLTRVLWSMVDQVTVITGTCNESILNAYAMIKLHVDTVNNPELQLLINSSASTQDSFTNNQNVYDRLSGACQRLLGLQINPSQSMTLVVN